MRLRFSIGALCLLSIMTSGAQQQPKVTGFFTDMHYIPGAGDVLGTEVWIVYARDRFYAAVQEAEGEPDPPIVVPVEVSGSRVKFTVTEHLIDGVGQPAPGVATHYQGTVSRVGLLLSAEGNPARLLKRRNSYWQ